MTERCKEILYFMRLCNQVKAGFESPIGSVFELQASIRSFCRKLSKGESKMADHAYHKFGQENAILCFNEF